MDAATGKLIWSIGHTTYHVGDGMVTDLILLIPVWSVLPAKTVRGKYRQIFAYCRREETASSSR